MSKKIETTIWYQVWHTQDYSAEMNECNVIKHTETEVYVLTDYNAMFWLDIVHRRYTMFPSKDAAEVFVKTRIRNEIKRVEERLVALNEMHKATKNRV